MAAQNFYYECVNDEGTHLSGTIMAENEEAARAALLERDLMVLRLRQNSNAQYRALWARLTQRRVPLKEIILFSKQFRTLFNAGVPLTQLLRILQNQTENAQLRAALADIAQQVNEGKSLHAAFVSHPKIFPPLYCSMIQAGESSGALGDVLDRLTYLLAHEETVQKQIASALRYPKMVLIFMAAAFLLLLNVVIPQFVQIFRTAKIELPLPTRIAIEMNAFMAGYWWLCIGIACAAFFGIRWWLNTPTGRFWKDSLVLRLPIIGAVVQKSIMARFASIFSILQRSGVSVLDSIDILTGTLDNAAIAKEFAPIKAKLTAGQGLTEPLRSARYFSPLAINMIAVGESSGNLEKMLDELAVHYDEEVEFAVGSMTEAIGPVLLLCLGVVVLFFALAIFLPMWDMTQIARG